MAILKDRIKETSTTSGTGDITLDGASASFQSFSAVGDGNVTYYTIQNGNDWEVGEGTYASGTNTLSRDSVFDSSNSGSRLSLSGTSTIFVTYPAERSVYQNTDSHVIVESGIDFTPLSDTVYPAWKEGRVFYDNENKSITVYNDQSGISLQVGFESYVRVRNNTGSTITNGSAVYISGSQGTHPLIGLANASGESQSNVLGLATHDISDSTFGYVTTFGLVRGIDTSLLSEGSGCFLGNTDGGLLDAPPSPPSHNVSIGHVVTSHASNGSVFVQVESPKMGGNHVGSTGDINNSGIPYISLATEDGDGVLSTSPSFVYDQANSRVNLPSGGLKFNDGTIQTTEGIVSGDNISLLVNDSGYINAHPPISAASSSDNSGRTYIQDILLDENGHVTGVTTATETGVDTDTTYTAGTGLELSGTEFNIDSTVIQSGDNVSLLTNDAGYTSATGDVVGPGSATDNAIVIYNGTTGKSIQNSSATISDEGKAYFQSAYLGTAEPTGSPTITVDFNLASLFKIDLDENKTVNFSNSDAGQRILVNLKQQGAGSFIVADSGDWANIKWTDDTAPTLSTASGTVDTIGILVASTGNYYGYVVGQGIIDS